MKKKYFIYGVLAGIFFAFIISSANSVLDESGRSKPDALKPQNVYASNVEEVLTLQNVFVDVAKRVKPSVVQVTTERIVEYRTFDPFRGFEDLLPFRVPERGQPDVQERRVPGLGSGFIVDPQGYIITNNHVIEGVDKIIVSINEGVAEYEAEVIGTDPKTDLALIKINAGYPLPAVTLGDSDNLQVAEWVMAVGNPLWLSATVTVGVVSATGRRGLGITHYEDFIQTDAAINRGNSGGPLVNMRGEVIGVNTFIVSPQVADNLGFAIPVNIVRNVFSQLRDTGRVSRGFLGVVLQAMDADHAQYYGLERPRGVIVVELVPGMPAEKAGVEKGDVIIKFGGEEVLGIADLQMRVADAPVNREVEMVVIRDGQEINISIVVAEMPDSEIVAAPHEHVWRGMRASSLTPEAARNLGMEAARGVVVMEVERGSPADEAGIVPSAVIDMINNRVVQGLEEFKNIVDGIPAGRDARLRVVLRGQARFLILKGETR